MKVILLVVSCVGIIWAIWMLSEHVDSFAELSISACEDTYLGNNRLREDWEGYGYCLSTYQETIDTWVGWSVFCLIVGTPIAIICGVSLYKQIDKDKNLKRHP